MATDRWRRLGANLALLGVSAGLMFLFFEGLARVYYARVGRGKERNERAEYTEHDPYLGWRKH